MHDEYGLRLAIETAGEHTLKLIGSDFDVSFVPVKCGDAETLCFLPVVGTVVYKVYAKKAPVLLRFRHCDVETAELTAFSLLDHSKFFQRRKFGYAWKATTHDGVKFKLLAIRSKLPGAEIATSIRAAAKDEWGPKGAFATDHPELIVGWSAAAIEVRNPARVSAGANITVALHLSDASSWSEYEPHLNYMPEAFKLYVTTPLPLPDNLLQQIQGRSANVEIVQTGQHGGATAAFFELLYRGCFDGDQIICRLADTSTERPPSMRSNSWLRRANLLSLLASPSRVEAACAKLCESTRIGLVGSAELRKVIPMGQLVEDAPAVAEVATDFGFRLGLSGTTRNLEYFAGGSFWVRSQALATLRDLCLSDADFQPNVGCDWAVRSRALELLLCCAIRRTGHSIVDIAETDFTGDRALSCEVGVAPWRDVSMAAKLAGRKVCLFASYLPDGRYTDATLHYMRQLRQAGFYVFALAAVADVDAMFVAPDPAAADAFALRANVGYDFALWAAALRRHPELLRANALLFANDSVFGPLRPLADFVARIDLMDADFIGMTESFQHQRHFQSYFLYFKSAAVSSEAFMRFWLNVRSQPRKSNLIRAYEVSMLAKLEAAGLRGEVLFPNRDRKLRRMNPTIHGWRKLNEEGFPFVKIELLRDNPANENLSGWREIVAAHGYDTELISRFFAQRFPEAAAMKVAK